ncbi:MAG TPA: carboxypeptidase-like regulatory domain-containing protein, partial [Geothrix sp.]
MRQTLNLALVLCAIQGVAQAQSASGTVGGRVLDDQGRPVVGATVLMENKISGYRHAVKTDAQGR